jgi:ribosomal protein S12 methylthiotransferase accessory factor
VDYVRLDGTVTRNWANVLFWPTSNGLAVGNTPADAILHGLNEIIERENVTGYEQSGPAGRVYVDPESCRDSHVTRIYDALRMAGCSIVVCDITGPIGLPCYAATIWSADVPVRCGGFGCHVDRAVALGRAMAEALLSRLATISGTRDDIDYDSYAPAPAPAEPAELVSLPEYAVPGAAGESVQSVIRYCASKVAAVTGIEPFAVRLDHDDIGIPAVKVIAPGLGMMGQRA